MCMTKKQPLLTKPSEPDKVDAYMQNLKHPLADVVAALRQIILGTDGEIGEEIKWNAPTFFTQGRWRPQIRRSTSATSSCSISSRKIASAWYFRGVRKSTTVQDSCKAITPTEEGWHSFTTWKKFNPKPSRCSKP